MEEEREGGREGDSGGRVEREEGEGRERMRGMKEGKEMVEEEKKEEKEGGRGEGWRRRRWWRKRRRRRVTKK